MKMRILIRSLTLVFFSGPVVFCQAQEKSIEELIQVLKSPNPHLLDWSDFNRKEDAIEVLGEIGDSRAVEALFEALKKYNEYPNPKNVDHAIINRHNGICSKSVEALGRIANTQVVEPLIWALKNGTDWTVRYPAADALGRIGDTTAVGPLILSLKNDKFSSVREHAADALGKIGDKRAREPLIDALNDLAGDAVEALIELGDTTAVEPWMENVIKNNRSTRARDKTVYLLRRIGDKRAVELLIEALKDDELEVRVNAVHGLDYIGDPIAIEPLKVLLAQEATLLKILPEAEDHKKIVEEIFNALRRFARKGHTAAKVW